MHCDKQIKVITDANNLMQYVKVLKREWEKTD
nr:MAG TPA: hypothetical protein [Caudoviricetes sp.]